MNPTKRIIEKFGGLSQMARALGHRYPSTVQGWQERGTIPSSRIPHIIAVAKERGIKLDYADFFDSEAA